MKSNLAKSHDEMLAFLERLIVNSDKFPGGRTPTAQRHYNKAKKLAAQAHKVRGVPMSPAHRGDAA